MSFDVTVTYSHMGTETFEDVSDVDVKINNGVVEIDGDRYGDTEPGKHAAIRAEITEHTEGDR